MDKNKVIICPKNTQKIQRCLPCTTNFSRGDFPATTVAKSDRRMKEFILFEDLSCVWPLCKKK